MKTPLGEVPATTYEVSGEDGTRELSFHRTTAGAPWLVVHVGPEGTRRVERALVGRKDGEARLIWRIELASGNFVELNYHLGDGTRLQASFEADGPVAWNVHSHPDEQVVTHREGQAPAGSFSFAPPQAGAYSAMWHNRASASRSVLLEVRLDGDGKLVSSHPPWWRQR